MAPISFPFSFPLWQFFHLLSHPYHCLFHLLFHSSMANFSFIISSLYFIPLGKFFIHYLILISFYISFRYGRFFIPCFVIEAAALHIRNLMGSILKPWLIFGSIFIFELRLCHIMASNANKYINRVQCRHNIMQIHVRRATINNTTQIWTLANFIAGFLWIFRIYLNKEISY